MENKQTELRQKNSYEFRGRVRYSEIDHRGTMTLPSLINYFQDCSTFQSEALGCGIDACNERKRGWVLSSWQVEIERYPRFGEKILVRTWSCGFEGLYGYRNFCMEDGKGEIAVRAYTVWVYMDLEKGRPAKVDPEEAARYGCGEPLAMEPASRKVRMPKEAEAMPDFPVRRYHIDTNEHVNNCQYVQMALECIPHPEEIKSGIKLFPESPK